MISAASTYCSTSTFTVLHPGLFKILNSFPKTSLLKTALRAARELFSLSQIYLSRNIHTKPCARRRANRSKDHCQGATHHDIECQANSYPNKLYTISAFERTQTLEHTPNKMSTPNELFISVTIFFSTRKTTNKTLSQLKGLADCQYDNTKCSTITATHDWEDTYHYQTNTLPNGHTTYSNTLHKQILCRQQVQPNA